MVSQVSTGKNMILHGMNRDLPETTAPERAFCRGFGIRSALAFPLYHRDALARASKLREAEIEAYRAPLP